MIATLEKLDWLWPPYVIGQAIIFSSCHLFYLLFFFSSPNFSRRRLDVCHTSTHGVALVRISDAGLKCAARSSLKMQDAKNRQKFAICAPSHDFVGLYLTTEACIDNRKKNLLNSSNSQMSSQYGKLRPTNGWDRFTSLGTPANFNGFRVLAVLLHGTLVVGVSQTPRRWTEGASYIRQGGHHVGHWPTFLVFIVFTLL